MANSFQVGRFCQYLSILCLLLVLGMASGMELARRTRRSKELDPSLTRYDEDCPNGLIAYEKFNRETGVFDCAIKTAEICFALCEMMYSSNWDISNTVGLSDTLDREQWYCRALPGYPTRPCYFKPRAAIEADVGRMHS